MGRRRNVDFIKRRTRKRKELKKLKSLKNSHTSDDTDSSSNADLPPFVDIAPSSANCQGERKQHKLVKQEPRKANWKTKLSDSLKNGHRDPLVVGLEMLNALKYQQFYLKQDASLFDDPNYLKKKW
jgi:hypothetical protein